MDWMDCDGLQWIATDCDQEWLAELTPIQTTLHIDAPHPNHTRCARSNRRRTLKTAPRVQTVLLAQNGAVRSKRRCAFKRCSALETAPRAHNGVARSKWRCAFKTARRAQNGAARSNGVVRSNEGRQGVGKGSAD